MSSTSSIIQTSVSSVGTLAVLNLIGGWLGTYRKGTYITSEHLKFISHLASNFFLPCMTANALATSLDISYIGNAGLVLIWGIANIGLAAFMAKIFLLIVPLPDTSPSMKRDFVSACCFGNSVGFPIVILKTLSTAEGLSYDRDAFAKLSALLFIYSIGFNIIFWSIGCHFIVKTDAVDRLLSAETEKKKTESITNSTTTTTTAKTTGKNEAAEEPVEERDVIINAASHMGEDLPSDNTSSSSSSSTTPIPKVNALRDGLLNPMMLSLAIGVVIGLVSPLKKLFIGENAPLVFFTRAIAVYGEPGVGVMSMIIGAILGKALVGFDHRKLLCSCLKEKKNREDGEGEAEAVVSSTIDSAPSSSPVSGDAAGQVVTVEIALSCQKEEGQAVTLQIHLNSSFLLFPSLLPNSSTSPPPIVANASNNDKQSALDPNTKLEVVKAMDSSSSSSPLASSPPTPPHHDALMTNRFLLTLLFVKLCLVPIVQTGVVYLFADHLLDIWSSNEETTEDTVDYRDLVKLVLYIEANVPTANVVVVVLTKAGKFGSAQAFARSFILQYLICIFTLVLSTSFAMIQLDLKSKTT